MIYTVGWALWALWLVVEEGLALWKGGSNATLSSHVWNFFGTSRSSLHAHPSPSPALRGRRFLLAAFLAWLSLHFLTGGVF